MSSRFDVARYHKPLSVAIFGGGSVALLIASTLCFMNDSTGLGIAFAIAFLLIGVPATFYFLDLFVWEPRRSATTGAERMGKFNKTERHKRDRVRHREQGVRG